MQLPHQARPALISFPVDNPASFVAVIKCGCLDTFQSAYPQCLSCFIEVRRLASCAGSR